MYLLKLATCTETYSLYLHVHHDTNQNLTMATFNRYGLNFEISHNCYLHNAVTNLAAIDYRSVYIESLPSLHAKTLLKYREFSIYDVCVVGGTWSSSIVLKTMTGVNTLQIYHM